MLWIIEKETLIQAGEIDSCNYKLYKFSSFLINIYVEVLSFATWHFNERNSFYLHFLFGNLFIYLFHGNEELSFDWPDHVAPGMCDTILEKVNDCPL